MNNTEKRRVAALRRRHTHLTERLQNWDHGDQDRTRGERSAIWWALTVIYGADEEGALSELEQIGKSAIGKEAEDE